MVENIILALIAFIGLTLALGKKAYEEDRLHLHKGTKSDTRLKDYLI